MPQEIFIAMAAAGFRDQVALAKQAGTSRVHLCAVFNGRHRASPKLISRIAAALCVPEKALISWLPPYQPNPQRTAA